MLLDSLPQANFLIWRAITLATKGKKSASATAGETKITRITASDTKPVVAKTAKPKTETKQTAEEKEPKTGVRNPLPAIGGYFAGAWYELKQVRWPNRRATWSMTMAVLAFTAFFVVLILLLDALFKYLFQLILG
ncbi:MAG TPA: preprotein translocase subunit SecE [Candidatus Saccharimonadales bacterium]